MEQLPTFTSVSPSAPAQSEQGNRLGNANLQSNTNGNIRNRVQSQDVLQEGKPLENNKNISEFSLQFLEISASVKSESDTSQQNQPTLNIIPIDNKIPGQLLVSPEGSVSGQELPLAGLGLPQIVMANDSQSGLKDISLTQNAVSLNIDQGKAKSLPLSLKHILPVSENTGAPNDLLILANVKQTEIQKNINSLSFEPEQSVNSFISQSQLLKLLTDKNADSTGLSMNSELGKIEELLGAKMGADNVVRSETGNPLSRVVEQVGIYSEIGDSRYRQADPLEQSGKSSVMTAMKQEIDSPVWGREFSNRIMWMAKNKMYSAQLRVDPPNLGVIEIKITVNQDQATVSFAANNAIVRDAIESASIRLKEQFMENGFQSVDVDVSSREEKKQQQEKLEELPIQLVAQSSDEEQRDENINSVNTLIQNSSMVDYFV